MLPYILAFAFLTLPASDRLPLSFEANVGQSDARVRYMSRGQGYALFLTPAETVLSLRNHKGKAGAALRMSLIGASRLPAMEALDPLPGKSHYLIGNSVTRWHTNVPQYARVRYRDVYPGIDVLYYGRDGQLEYDFVVAPGADPNRIGIAFDGIQSLRLDRRGELVLKTAIGGVHQHKPVVYQQIAGVRKKIEGRYVRKGKREVGFVIARYDANRPLVIDPSISYSSYLGGAGLDQGAAVAVDSSGNAYVTGTTSSANFPATIGARQTASAGFSDVFVTKLDPSGATRLYSTYLGGNSDDFGRGIAVDSAGNAYVTGATQSSNFPIQNQLQAFGGVTDAFLVKLNSTGSTLLYSTYLGGGSSDEGYGVALDSGGNAYVTGWTSSSNFPTTSSARQGSYAGNSDAFLTKLNPALSGAASLVYSTYLGGSSLDQGFGVAVDVSGNAYVTGSTWSGNFPTQNAYQSFGGSVDAFVAKLNPSASGAASLLYSTYLGGNAVDEGRGIAVDSLGNAYVTGNTSSTNFPATTGALQTTNALFDEDAFFAKLNPGVTGAASLVYSTYLGGSGADSGLAIAVDSAGIAYVTGQTASGNFPQAASLRDFSGGADAFVAQLNPALSGSAALLFSTFWGGSANDSGRGIAVDVSGNVYVTGVTDSTNFPAIGGVQQASPGGGIEDAFVFRIGSTPCAFTINRASGSASPLGDTLGVNVTASGSACSWNATSDSPWVTLGGTLPRNGTGTLRMAVEANPIAAIRTANLTIAGRPFTLVQGPLGCGYSLAPSTQTGTGAGGGFNFNVTTQAGCIWSPLPSQSFVTITQGNNSTGSAQAGYSATVNGSTGARTASLSVFGEIHQFIQSVANPAQQFTDVPITHPYYDFISIMRDQSITSGCGSNIYCPDSITTRGQMAVFIIRALYGGDTFPFPATPYFTDVPTTHPYFKFIQKMRDLGITSGCTSTTYCPDDTVTRGQMAVFIVRARLGLASGDPLSFPVTAFFTDVPDSHPYHSFIQKMRQLAVTSGCTTTTYCPDGDTTRGQMSVFIVRGLLTP